MVALASTALGVGSLPVESATGQAGECAQEITRDDRRYARVFARHVLDFASAMRNRGLPAWNVALPHGGAQEYSAAAEHQWRRFFDNIGISFGRMRSSAPMAVFYNPVLDIALLSLWEKQDDGYAPTSVRMLPGEKLQEPGVWLHPAVFSSEPSWSANENSPLAALGRTARSRVDSFHSAHPVGSLEPWRDESTLADMDMEARLVMQRLVKWDEKQRRMRAWWVQAVLADIVDLLAERDPAGLLGSAPDTAPHVAYALTRVPADFRTTFVLQMVLEGSAGERLLVGSLRDTLTVISVTCRWSGGGCAPREFEMMDLSHEMSHAR